MDAELYELLTELGRCGYMVHSYRLDGSGRPEVVAAVLNRDDCADVVILHGIARAYAFRTPIGEGRDVLNPTQVFWDCAARPVRALKALLALPEPGAKAAPTVLYPPQSGLCLPAELRGSSARVRRRGM